MKLLSLWQPWATLMALGEKRIETRSWATSYRGLVAIHAAKKPDRTNEDEPAPGAARRATGRIRAALARMRRRGGRHG